MMQERTELIYKYKLDSISNIKINNMTEKTIKGMQNKWIRCIQRNTCGFEMQVETPHTLATASLR